MLEYLLDAEGEEVFYTAPDQSASQSVTALVVDESGGYDVTDDGQRLVRVKRLALLADPTSPFGGIAEIERGGVFRIDGDDYRVDERPATRNGEHRVRVRSASSTARHSPSKYRSRR